MDKLRLFSVDDPNLDPALVLTPEAKRELKKQYQEHLDSSLLRPVDGKRLMEFVCRHLSKREQAAMIDTYNAASRRADAVEFMTGYETFVSHVEEIVNGPEIRTADRRNGRLTDEWADESGLPIALMVEIGSLILSKAIFTEEQRKNL
ncbi:MAG: hypothetical protein C4523_19710 [Myxococcales bacterium]|nr:MAG: hypothetical protein C4523_19710 [Myxococcales bacterium]